MASTPRRSLRLLHGNAAYVAQQDKTDKNRLPAVAPVKKRAAAAAESPVKKSARLGRKDAEETTTEQERKDGSAKLQGTDANKGERQSLEETTVAAIEAPVSRAKRKSLLVANQALKNIAIKDREKEDFSDVEQKRELRKRLKKNVEEKATSHKQIKPKFRSQAVVVMDDDTSSDEDAKEEDKPLQKISRSSKTASAPGSSTGKGKEVKALQRPPSLDRLNQPVRLLMKRKYDVDRDEMLAWEKRAVNMARELRTLESDVQRSNESGRMKEVMARVWQFVERCLKDRTRGMGDQEAVMLCNTLQGEFDEWERKRNMTITQRIKETVDNEIKEREKAASDDDIEEEEDEWEAMENLDGENDATTMQVHVQKQEHATHWKSKWLKQEVNRTMRARYENVHKAHLLSYISHLRHIATMALSRTSKHGEVPIAAIALSMLPEMENKRSEAFGKVQKEHFGEWCKRVDFAQWWWKNFEESEQIVRARSSPNLSDPKYEEDESDEGQAARSEEEGMSEWMMKRKYRSHKEAAIMCFSLIAAAGYTVRIVTRCEIVSKRLPESLEAAKDAAAREKEAKKVIRSKCEKEERRRNRIVDYWLETWDEVDELWRTMDMIRPMQSREELEAEEHEDCCDRNLYKEPLNACMEKEGVVLYFLAIDNEMNIRDVSARYIHPRNFVSKEFRNRRAKPEWLTELWEMELWRAHAVRSRMEDDDWMASEGAELPKMVGQFKDHPLYVLDKDVLKMQCIFPYNTPSLGEIRGYKIYSRKFLRPTNTAKWYEKMGRQVRSDEPPCGEKKLTSPFTGETIMQGLFGYWQTTPWDGGDVVNGVVPRNEFGNVYMYQPADMCPRGGIYLVPEGLQKVASELGKDFATAVVGWQYKSGNVVPILRGAVFAKEDVPALVAAWKACERRWKEEERKARSIKSLAAWKRLIKGMLRLAAMRREFEPIENKKKQGTQKLEVRAEENAAWPKQSYGEHAFDWQNDS